MKIVVDTCVFLAVAMREPEREHIIDVTAGHRLIAPELLPFEIGNALIGMVRKGALRRDELASAWDAVQQIAVELRPVDIQAALDIAVRNGIHAYDAYFLECARDMRSPLLTLDRRMKQVARETHITVLE